MEKLDEDELRNRIFNSCYSDAYVLIKYNIELFRKKEDEVKEEIFNREILNYFKSIRNRCSCLEDYRAALLNINFFNKEVALYLLDSGVDLYAYSDPLFMSDCRLIDVVVCNSNDKDVISKALYLDREKGEIRLYNNGNNYITSVGAYLRCGAVLEANAEVFKKIRYLRDSETIEDILDRFNKNGYCLLNDKEKRYINYYHSMIVDIDNYLEDDNQKRFLLSMILYSSECPYIDQASLPVIKSILGNTLYEAYKNHLEKEITEGKKFVKITELSGDFEDYKDSEVEYSVMEKGLSFSLNISDEDVCEFVKKRKEIN